MPAQRILMCAPDFFGVDYVINPWMEGNQGKTKHPLAVEQWNSLKRTLAMRVELAFLEPRAGLPDLVFTANAGLVLGKLAVVSRFRSSERRREEPWFRQWFEQNGFTIVPWPEDVLFEGAGDALFDRGQKILWSGFGFRSDENAPKALEHALGYPTIGIRLIDPRFYHLDTCFCPLAGGYLLYYPWAFDQASQKKITELVPAGKRIAVSEADALQYACNAVDLNGHVIMNGASTDLQDTLRRHGFTPIAVPLSEFMKSGGAAKCLTLKLAETL